MAIGLLAIAGLMAAPVRAAAAGSSKSRAGVRTLYLVRHGLYDEDDPRDPDVGRHLVPEGREQARLVGARLAALPVRITALHASTMTRARETAEIIAHELSLTPRLSAALRECTPPY